MAVVNASSKTNKLLDDYWKHLSYTFGGKNGKNVYFRERSATRSGVGFRGPGAPRDEPGSPPQRIKDFRQPKEYS